MDRLAISFGRNYHLGPEMIASYTQQAESLGYDTLVISEAWGRDAMVRLGHLAARTSRIKFITGIVTVWGRSPAMMAQAAATVDEISKGRLSLGIGVTGPKVVQDWHGGKWEKPLQRTREYIDIVRLAVSGQRVNYDGQFFHLKDFRLQFEPYRDRIPMFIGAFGPKNLQLAGEIADGWVGNEVVWENLGQFMAEIKKGADRAGRKLDGFEATLGMELCFGADIAAVRKILRPDIAYRIGGLGPFHYGVIARQGFEKECATIKKLWTEFKRDEAATHVTDEMLEKIAFVGNAAAAKERIAKLREGGITLPVISLPKGVTNEMIVTTMKTMAP